MHVIFIRALHMTLPDVTLTQHPCHLRVGVGDVLKNANLRKERVGDVLKI